MKHSLFVISLVFLLAVCCLGLGRLTAPLPLPITGDVFSLGKEGSGLEQFPSKEALVEWLAQDDTDEHLIMIANEKGEINFEGACEDYALQLQERALTDGYKMSFLFVTKGSMWELFRTRIPRGQAHAMNLTVIGNYIYAIEPTNDKITHIGYLD